MAVPVPLMSSKANGTAVTWYTFVGVMAPSTQCERVVVRRRGGRRRDERALAGADEGVGAGVERQQQPVGALRARGLDAHRGAGAVVARRRAGHQVRVVELHPPVDVQLGL